MNMGNRLGLLQKDLGVLADHLGVLGRSASALPAHEALVRLILVGQHVSDLKKALLQDIFREWGVAWLDEEELDEVMSTIETVIERIRAEIRSCPRIQAPSVTNQKGC